MPKDDKEVIPGYDVQVIPVSGGQAPAPVGVPVGISTQPPVVGGVGTPAGNGYVVTSAPNTPIILVPPTPPQQSAQPSMVVITLSPKKDEEKKKKSSSVFQRL